MIKKVVNVVNHEPLVDTDFFRGPALYFKKFGCYTKLTPNPHPQSEYMQFWREEFRRCRDGLVRESDGEWITGYHYFYLNYSPIWLTDEVENDKTNSSKKHRVDRKYDFPRFWDSDYEYFHYIEQAEEEGLDGVALKTRGRGYSFKAGAMAARNYYMYPGSRTIAVAAGEEFLIKDGILNKAWDVLDWIDSHTPWKKERQVKNEIMHKRASYVDPTNNIESGFKSEILGVTLKNDTSKIRGKRAKLILFEEAGMFPGMLHAWQIAEPSVKQGKSVYGIRIAFGTGGQEGASFEALEELFYNPDGYQVYSVPNVWDPGREATKCGFFIPESKNREGYYDKDGNSFVKEATEEVLQEREVIRKNSRNPLAVTYKMAESPLIPQEAILRTVGALFPVKDLKVALAELEVNHKLLDSSLKGYLIVNKDGMIEWKNSDEMPIRDFPITSNKNIHGCIEIFEPPKDGKEYGRYISGIDPYDDDESTTSSLGSCFILDVFTDRIVAEYTGRPNTAVEFYENCRRLLMYYSAECNYENNKKGLFTYFDQKHSLHLLCETPKSLRDVENIRIFDSGNKAHPYSEHVYTPTGMKKWADIQIGDVLFGEKGNITTIIDIPYDAFTDIYKITLWDNREVFCSSEHLWKVIVNNKEKTLTTSELKKDYKKDKYNKIRDTTYTEYKYAIPNHKAVNFKYKKVPVDAYTMGLLLGDGTFSHSNYPVHKIQIASCPKDMDLYKKHIPYLVNNTSEIDHFNIIIPKIGDKLKNLGLYNKLSKSKFIPDIYKYNTKKVRIEILQGLLDTDGHVEINGFPKFSSISLKLANDVAWLSRSLGINCKIYKSKAGYKKDNIYHRTNDVYTVVLWTNEKLFKLDRKINKLTKFISAKSQAHKDKMFIKNIEYSHKEKAKCVTVDSNSNCYLVNEFICTHNSKGTNASKEVNKYGRRLLHDWMVSQAYEKDDGIENLHLIRSRSLIQEAIAWNPDGNFDRISAMGMLMILKQDRQKVLETRRNKIQTKASDPFFSRHTGDVSSWKHRNFKLSYNGSK